MDVAWHLHADKGRERGDLPRMSFLSAGQLTTVAGCGNRMRRLLRLPVIFGIPSIPLQVGGSVTTPESLRGREAIHTLASDCLTEADCMAETTMCSFALLTAPFRWPVLLHDLLRSLAIDNTVLVPKLSGGKQTTCGQTFREGAVCDMMGICTRRGQ